MVHVLPSEFDARRICVIKPSALGDIVQSLPLCYSLRARFPGARISWIANREYVELLSGVAVLDEVIPFGRRDAWGRVSSWGRLFALLARLHRSRFDLVLDLQGLMRTAIMSMATRAPKRIGLETAREGAHRACHETLPGTARTVPAHQRYRRVAQWLGVRTFPDVFRLEWDSEIARWADRQLLEAGRPVMVVHAGARWISKRWPAERFASVAAKAIRRLDFSVILAGSRADVRIAQSVESALRKFISGGTVLNLAGQTTLPQLSALLQSAALLFSNDSGPMHLAAALGTPVLAIFTCTDPVRSGPSGQIHELLSAEVACAGSYKKRCPHRGTQHLACMDALSTETVYAALVRLMTRNRLPRAA